MNYALRHCGLPSLGLWETVLPQFKTLVCHEDNQAMIRICVTGRNPTMRYISRTQGLNIAWLYERFQSPELELRYEASSAMAADIFTKSFTDKVKWAEVCRLVNVVDKDVFYSFIAAQTAGGGSLIPPRLLLEQRQLRTRKFTSVKGLVMKVNASSRGQKHRKYS